MACFRVAAFAVAMGISVLSPSIGVAQRPLVLAAPDAPAAYRAQNRDVAPAPEVAPAATPEPEPPPPDPAARFRDAFFASLLGYGLGAGTGALIGWLAETDDPFAFAVPIVLVAQLGCMMGAWIGGVVHDAGRYDGAAIGTLIGVVLAGAFAFAMGGPIHEDAGVMTAIGSIGLLAPPLAAVLGSEIAHALSGGGS